MTIITEFSALKVRLRLLPTSWGAALSCWFARRPECCGRWSGEHGARDGPSVAASPWNGRTRCVPTSLLRPGGWRQTARKPWSTRSRASVEAGRRGRRRVPSHPSHTEVDARYAETFWHPSRDAESHLTFVMFPVIDWHFRFQRPQQLARALGKRGHRVFYVSPDFLLSKDDKPFKVLESPAGNVHLCRLACSPPHPRLYETLLSPEQLDEVATNLLALEAYCAGAPIIRVVQHPFWTQLMRQWDDGFLIYDMMDDHSGFLGNGTWLPQQEEELLRQQTWSPSRPICWRPRLGILRRASLSRTPPTVTTSLTVAIRRPW